MSKPSSSIGSAAKAMVAIMGSRILGLVRDVVLNSIFGAGMVLDAFWTAFRVPNLLRDLLAEGALSVSFTTTFSKKMEKDGKAEAFLLANRMLTSMSVILIAICLLGVAFSDQLIIYTIGRGFSPEKQQLTIELTRILFPFIVFVSLAAIYMGLLNSLGSFVLPASASTVFNVTSILFGLGLGWLYDPNLGPMSVYGFAWGTVLGGAMQLIIQMPTASGYGLRLRPRFDWKNPDLIKVYKLSLPAIAGVAAVQVNVLINASWASYMGDGAVTYFSNAFRLMQLPIGLFGVAIGMVVLPAVSRSVAQENMHHFRVRVVEGLKLALFMTVPASIGLFFLSEPIIGVIYEHGKYTHADTVETARLLQAFTLGLAGYACIKVLAPTFYALDMPRVPVLISIRAIGLNIVFTLILIKVFGMGLVALPLSISLVALLNLFQLTLALSKRLGSITTGTDFPGFFLKMILLTTAFAILLAAIHFGIGRHLRGTGTLAIYLAITVPAAFVAYFGLAYKLGFDEVDHLVEAFMRRAGMKISKPEE
jgi:putative peptidoglycan lipid II flippase